jgi:hypothetical protein
MEPTAQDDALMDMSALPTDALIVALVATFVQAIKPLLEKIVKPDDTAHDSIVQLIAIVLGILFIGMEKGFPTTSQAAIEVIGYGVGTALTAIGGYHTVIKRVSNSTAAPTP